MTAKPIIVSGNRPTGRLHLGNYWGALRNWVTLQDKYDCRFFIADLHALTTGHEDTSALLSNTREMVIDWLAAGLDPEKCVIFQQSRVPGHAELALLLGMITPVGWLLRNPTYKEQLVELHKRRYAGQQEKGADSSTLTGTLGTAAKMSEEEMAAMADFSSFGFLGYPVLMAADILLYGSELVPVGQDQLPHLEIARDLARRFADLYGPGVLVEPKPLLSQVPKVPGLDGSKMSKSYNNTIDLGEDSSSAEKKVMRMFTDPNKKRATDQGNPEGCVVYAFHKIYNPDCASREKECRAGSIGCVACKKHLFTLMKPLLDEHNARRESFAKDTARVDEILERGNRKALADAEKTMTAVKKAMKLA